LSDDKEKLPISASFEKVNILFHAMDKALGEKLKETLATPYEVELAITCLSYKLKSHEMVAFFTQCIDSIQAKDKEDDEGKDRSYIK